LCFSFSFFNFLFFETVTQTGFDPKNRPKL